MRQKQALGLGGYSLCTPIIPRSYGTASRCEKEMEAAH